MHLNGILLIKHERSEQCVLLYRPWENLSESVSVCSIQPPKSHQATNSSEISSLILHFTPLLFYMANSYCPYRKDKHRILFYSKLRMSYEQMVNRNPYQPYQRKAPLSYCSHTETWQTNPTVQGRSTQVNHEKDRKRKRLQTPYQPERVLSSHFLFAQK